MSMDGPVLRTSHRLLSSVCPSLLWIFCKTGGLSPSIFGRLPSALEMLDACHSHFSRGIGVVGNGNGNGIGNGLLWYYVSYHIVPSLAALEMTMIIPIRAPSSSDSAGEAEWVMIELNGELLRPMDETMQPPQVNASVDTIKRRVELGSLNFDADVSELLSLDIPYFNFQLY